MQDTLSKLVTQDFIIENYPNLGLTRTGLKRAINKRHQNGMAPCVFLRGNRVLIDIERFEAWLRHEQDILSDKARR